MKTFLLLAITAVLLVPGLVFAEDHDEHDDDDVWDAFELRERELEIEEREMELHFQRQAQEIKLEKMRGEMQRHEKPQKKDKFAQGKGYWGKFGPGQYKGDWDKNSQKKNDKFKHHKEKRDMFFLICLVVNILLAVWVYKDIREKSSSSGVWIVIVLLTGLFGAVVYAIVRLGDLKRPSNG